MKSVNATVLGNLVSAHYEHDEEKFAAYVQFIIDAYEEQQGFLKDDVTDYDGKTAG